MKIYLVGGALRDDLLGLPVQDRDFVVVGATVEAMVAQGFKPVGQSFPVFLHPQTHEEHALARTERKDGHGYKGFVFHAAPTVTLEEDLARRDITINAMAKNLATSEMVDPFGGQRDLKEKILRHVSPAFVEDPVRVLRVARFAARFADFHIAHETSALMKQLTESGELDHLVPERVWQEISRGLMEPAPQRMVEVLQACGAWPILLNLSPPVHTTELVTALIRAARANFSLPVRYTLLAFYSTASHEQVMHLNSRLTVPTDCADLALLFMRQHQALARANTLTAEELNTLFERCDILRRPERLNHALEVLACVEPAQSTQIQWIKDAAQVLRQMDVSSIVANAKDRDVGEKIKQARIASLSKFKG